MEFRTADVEHRNKRQPRQGQMFEPDTENPNVGDDEEVTPEALARTSAELANAFAQAFESSDDVDPGDDVEASERGSREEGDEPAAGVVQRDTDADRRLYAVKPADTAVHVKQTWDKEYCFAKNPGEDYFHMLVCGEFYVAHGEEQFCLTCAIRRGLITEDRENWKRHT